MDFADYVKKYVLIKDDKGNAQSVDNATIEFIRLVDQARKEGGTIRQVWMRTRYQWIIIKP